MLFMKSYLEHYAGEDVLGVEIMYDPNIIVPITHVSSS